MKDVLSFGEPLVGFYPTGNTSLIEDGPVIKTWGGDTSNLAIGIARLGHSVSYLTKVGDDPFGEGFLRLWNSNGVDTSLVVVDQERRTGLYFVSFEGKRHRLTYYRSGSAASSITRESVSAELVARYRILHLSGISIGMGESARETGKQLIELARHVGTKVSFDVNYRAAQWKSSRIAAQVIMDTIGDGVDILEITDDEMAALGWGDSINGLAEKISRMWDTDTQARAQRSHSPIGRQAIAFSSRACGSEGHRWSRGQLRCRIHHRIAGRQTGSRDGGIRFSHRCAHLYRYRSTGTYADKGASGCTPCQLEPVTFRIAFSSSQGSGV